jgi:Helix-turn-helix domain of resolvase/Resolvase, N terminal domain
LIDTVTALDEREVGFRSLRRTLTPPPPGAGWCFICSGALAQFEREIVRDRTVAGLAAARARGRKGGRRAKLNPDQVKTARRLYDERELTVEAIGRILGVSRTSIYRALGRTCRRPRVTRLVEPVVRLNRVVEGNSWETRNDRAARPRMIRSLTSRRNPLAPHVIVPAACSRALANRRCLRPLQEVGLRTSQDIGGRALPAHPAVSSIASGCPKDQVSRPHDRNIMPCLRTLARNTFATAALTCALAGPGVCSALTSSATAGAGVAVATCPSLNGPSLNSPSLN